MLYNVHVFACLWVCLLVCQKPDFTKFAVYVTRGHGSVLRYVLQVLWMMSCFDIVCQVRIKTWSLRHTRLFTVTHQVAPLDSAPGREVCRCRLPFLLPAVIF